MSKEFVFPIAFFHQLQRINEFDHVFTYVYHSTGSTRLHGKQFLLPILFCLVCTVPPKMLKKNSLHRKPSG